MGTQQSSGSSLRSPGRGLSGGGVNVEAAATQVQNHEGRGLEQKSQDSTCRWQKPTLTFRACVNGTRRGGSASGTAGSRSSGDVCVIRWLSPHPVALPSLTSAHLGRAPNPKAPSSTGLAHTTPTIPSSVEGESLRTSAEPAQYRALSRGDCNTIVLSKTPGTGASSFPSQG